MADSDVEVRFGAVVGDLLGGIEEAKAAIQSITQPVQEVASSLKELGEIFVAAFALDKVANFASQMEDLGEQTERTAAMLGVSTTQAQELGFIAQATGGSADGMAMAMERLQLNLQRAQNSTSQQALALRALGLSAKELIGVPLPEQLNLIADAVAKFGDGGNKTAIVMALLGRSGAQMIPVLDQGREGLDRFRQTADESTVVTHATVDALSRAHLASVTLTGSITALGEAVIAQFANSIITATNDLTTFVSGMSALVQTGHIGEAAMVTLSGAVRETGANLAWTAKELADLAQPWRWNEVLADWQKGNDAVLSIQKETDDKLLQMTTQATGELHKILSEPQPTNKTQAPALAVPDTSALKAAADQYSELMKQAQDQYNTTIKLADTAFNQTKEHLAAEVQLHEITYGQETAQLLSALDQRRAAEQSAVTVEVGAENAALEAKIALYARGTAEWQKAVDQQTELLQKAYDQRRELDAKYFAERQKLVDQAAEQEEKTWKSAADMVSGAFNSQLQKLLAGTETWSQAMKKISADLVLKFIEDQIKLSVEYLANQTRMLAAHIASEMTQTAATTAGTAAREAAQASASSGSILETIANALKAIFASAGQTAAGVSANVAPAVGPAAPAIGAAAGAAVAAEASGLASFDVGTDYVMRSGLAMIHKGEAIVPARANPFTGGGFAAAQGSGDSNRGGDTHVHISALDSRSIKRFFDDNAGHMIKAIQKGMKNNAHLRPA
jgi:hypothetical protein